MGPRRLTERYGWVVFVIIGIMGVVIALPVVIDPGRAPAVFEQMDGMAMPASLATDAVAMAYLAFVSRFAFTATLGVDLLTVLVAVFAFRHGARWAWFALCYWPALFLTNAITYDAPARYVQVGMLVLTAATLAATGPRAWRHDPAGPSAETVSPRARSQRTSHASPAPSNVTIR
jgi:hypothetical protein